MISLAQKILNEQGYIVLGGDRNYQRGEIISECGPWPDGTYLQEPVVVESTATQQDFDQQVERFNTWFPRDSCPDWTPPQFFYKVIAE